MPPFLSPGGRNSPLISRVAGRLVQNEETQGARILRNETYSTLQWRLSAPACAWVRAGGGGTHRQQGWSVTPTAWPQIASFDSLLSPKTLGHNHQGVRSPRLRAFRVAAPTRRRRGGYARRPPASTTRMKGRLTAFSGRVNNTP